MLGQFFGGRKGHGAPSPTATLDSATEESHTRHLLYPDAHTLYHPEGQPYPLHGAALALGSGHDGPLPEIDLELARDCRIIIAQDEFMGMPKTILFDSKPQQQRARADSPPQRARNFSNAAGTAGGSSGGAAGGTHRRASLVPEASTPRSPTVGAFNRQRSRGTSISSMPNIDEHAHQHQHAQQHAAASASMDVVKTCLDCMFGNTTMSYRGNSNKLHIVPLDPRPAHVAPPPAQFHDPDGSLGRSEGFRRRSHLATSYTPGTLPADLPRQHSAESIAREPRRRTIFITRMFSVVVPDEDAADSSSSQTRKTPMYAITIILHLPVTSTPSLLRPPSRSGRPGRGATSQPSTSAPGHDSLGSSADEDRRAGWAHMDSNAGIDSPLSASLNSDVDDRVDVIGQHWDVITRTLTSLQQLVQARILAHFKMEDEKFPPVVQQPRSHPTRYATREYPMPARRGTRLQPNALASDPAVKEAVALAGNRLVSGMRIPRVITGQGKWGVWREEARWLGRWAGRREENFFFFNLLTAFLGNHTEWLNLLGPKWHRKRHRDQQRTSAGENLTISNRTVIVSPDKMAARRLIFLLAAFLPANTPTAFDGASPMRPSTSASLRGYSQSPPTNMPPSRKQSLRRQINRRGKQSLSNMRAAPGAVLIPTLGSAAAHSDSVADGLPEAQTPSRRNSIHSINTNLAIPSMSDSAITKSSTASMSTVTPENAVPIAHFTLPRTKSSGLVLNNSPESSESLASTNLAHTLRRSSTSHISNPSTDSGNSRWSVFTSFWNAGRRQSSDQRDFLQTTDDGLGISSGGSRGFERPRSQLELMVQELSMHRELFDESDIFDPSTLTTSITADNSPETYAIGGSSGVPASAARPIPKGSRHYDSMKLSVNAKDGVIDVDVPLPDFGSPLQSPLFGGGYVSPSSQPGSSYGETSMYLTPHCEPDHPVNAAGWLKQFHPDFAVQAIKPYSDLDRDIKRAMSAEPTPTTSAALPTLEQGPLERWIDVCSALVADTRTFSIKRIRLKRLVKLIPTPTYQQSFSQTPGVSGIPGRSQYGNPYAVGAGGPLVTEVHLDEEFTEEQIMDFDATLIDAVDRVLSQSGQASRAHSTTSSRSSSRKGRRDTRAGSDAGHHHPEVAHVDCKGIIFDALESVVRNVTAERITKDDPKDDPKDDSVSEKKIRPETAPKTAADSSLKEGVRRWLAEVE